MRPQLAALRRSCMSTPPSAQPPPPNKPRKKRSADVVSFEDLLAAYKTERGPGQLPAEGVVLIGVDFELQRRMAERMGIPPRPETQSENTGALNTSAPNFSAPNIGALNISAPQDHIGHLNRSAPNF